MGNPFFEIEFFCHKVELIGLLGVHGRVRASGPRCKGPPPPRKAWLFGTSSCRSYLYILSTDASYRVGQQRGDSLALHKQTQMSLRMYFFRSPSASGIWR